MSSSEPETPNLVYDWNTAEDRGRPPRERPIKLYDESLRDGLQSPSVLDPPIDQKIEMLHLMDRLGIAWADIGLPGAGPRAVEDVRLLAREIVDSKLGIRPSCAARTHEADIRPIAEISQMVGIPIEAMTFLGSSPIRQYVEGWDVARLTKLTADAVSLATKEGLPVGFVTEDTIRSRPETLDCLFRTAVDNGAWRLCLCDTVGHATPSGVRSLIRFARHVVSDMGMLDEVELDWHGHNDRGLALDNAICAVEEGIDRVHGTALGVGERVGNTAMDLLIVNLSLLGLHDHDARELVTYCRTASKAIGVPIPATYPLVGEDAFRTATGVHAAAVIKARNKGDDWLADRIYSGVPAGLFGLHQQIEIGPMSGASNVRFWLKHRGLPEHDSVVEAIFGLAKTTDHVLSDEEIMAVVETASRQES